MSDVRISTRLWLETHLRLMDQQAIAYYIVHRGAEFSGAVILKQNALSDGCRILTQARDEKGVLGWLPAFQGKWVDEKDADAYIRRAIDRDPDLWVIEIEDAQKRHPFEGKILE